MSIEKKGKGQEGGWRKVGSKEVWRQRRFHGWEGTSRVSPMAGRRVANMARAGARVQLAAVGHVEDPISPVTARGQSHAHDNWRMVSSRIGVRTHIVGQVHKREGQANRGRHCDPQPVVVRVQRPHNSFMKALSEAPTTIGAADVSQQERKQDLKTKSVQHRREHTNICVAIEPEGAKAVKQDEEWEEIKLAADSGATDTVIFPGELPSIELREGAPYKRGVEYEMANSSLCPNLGGKQFVGVTLKGKGTVSCGAGCRCEARLAQYEEVHQVG